MSWLVIAGQAVISSSGTPLTRPARRQRDTLHRDASAPQRSAYQPGRLIAGTIRNRLARLDEFGGEILSYLPGKTVGSRRP